VRDYADTCALAGRQAVHDVHQMANQFHLVQNAGDALKVVLYFHCWHQPTTSTPPEMALVVASAIPPSLAEGPGKTPQVQRGYRGSESMVRVVVHPCRTGQQAIPRPAVTLVPGAAAVQMVDQCGTGNVSTLSGSQSPISPRGPPQVTLSDLLAEQDPAAFNQWLRGGGDLGPSTVPNLGPQPLPVLCRAHRRAHHAAVLTMLSSTPQCQGQLRRVKLLKGLDYGRVKLDPLRQRILHRMVAPMKRAGRARQVQL
jgi:hypothetical protein